MALSDRFYLNYIFKASRLCQHSLVLSMLAIASPALAEDAGSQPLRPMLPNESTTSPPAQEVPPAPKPAASQSPVTAPPETVPMSASYSQLTRAVGRNDKKKPFDQEMKTQDQPRSIGKGQITTVQKDFERPSTPPTADDSIKLTQPPLKALVSIDKNLNPYGLEAQYSQEINLRDALMAASEGNLDILKTVTKVQTRKWQLLNAYTGYLPSVSLGLNEIGLNSVSAIPITAVAKTNTAGLTATTAGAASGIGTAGSIITTAAQTIKTSIETPLTVLNSGFTWKPFQGGKLIYTVLTEKHRLRAQRAELKGNVSDALLNCANDYYKLVLNDALLQIRTSAVATSEEQMRQNQSLEKGGLATYLDVLQAKTQLSKDRQNLIDQQKVRRRAAIELAHLLNANLGQDLIPTDRTLRKVRLLSSDLSITDLLKKAIDNRPELKQYEEMRQAAKKDILISTSSLLPTLSLGGNIIGIASNIGKMEPTLLLNFGVSWKFDGLGTKTATETQASRWQARQAMVEANQKFIDVIQQVRNSYNDSFTAESAIEETVTEVESATEELRLARLRLATGLGTNLDVLTAQRDLTQAKIDKAQALVNFNIAQVQLVHDIGLATIDNFSSGKLISMDSTR